jgi:predicted XRE-type DNA-binding protein
MESELKRGLLAAYRRLLQPLVRILLRNGIPYGEFAELAKEVYIDVVARDFKVPNRKMSQARIAIVTGLTRKEVARIIGTKNSGQNEEKSNLSRVSRVLTGWHTDSEFTGPYGLPLELKFEANDGEPNFLELVQRYSRDMAPRAMLDELMRIGTVKETEAGWYKVVTRTYTPAIDEPDSVERLAGVVYNFVSTIDRNIVEQEPNKRNFERHVFADNGIKKEDLPRFRAFIKKRAQLLLEEIDNWLSQLEEPDANKEEAVHTGLGIYHYVETEESTSTDTNK